jgi:hypothetical protein
MRGRIQKWKWPESRGFSGQNLRNPHLGVVQLSVHGVYRAIPSVRLGSAVITRIGLSIAVLQENRPKPIV